MDALASRCHRHCRARVRRILTPVPPQARPIVNPDTAESARDITELAVRLYGSDFVGERGVVHVTAVWADASAAYTTLRITPATPTNRYDRTALNLARARADAIVTTGKILREEPTVTHAFLGPVPHTQALQQWRMAVLGQERPPISLVLTSGRALDLEHPMFHSHTVPMVFTTAAAAQRLAVSKRVRALRIAGVADPTLRGAIDYLQTEHGAKTIVIEAGPTTSRDLYRIPIALDELLLSVCHATEIPAEAHGGPFLGRAALDCLLPSRSEPFDDRTSDTPWSFERRTRPPAERS